MIGSFVLNLSFFFSLFASVTTVLALKLKEERLLESGRRALLSTFILSTIACFRLAYAFLRDEFSIKYVASHSSSDLPTLYKITALWAGQEGSLLFWFWLLTLLSAVLILRWRRGDDIVDRSLPVLAFTQLFFSLLLILPSRPFERFPFIPEEGRGLNPLLQNPNMIFHPPALYVGYVGFTIPFALGIGAMLADRRDTEWLKRCRVWTMISWIFLTIGIILGMKWSYVELGWGGYWAWDPVENASLMPWLTATAFLHSIMMQERRDLLKFWNILLIAITFELSIFGTFLTRSGVIGSVHSFVESSIGYYFLAFIALSSVSTIVIIYLRRELLQSQKGIDTVFSREGVFLLNNLVLCALCFATFLGTMLPLFSELLTGKKVVVGPAFFNRVNTPLAVLLLLLTGICPLISWRRASISNFLRNFLIPISLSAIIAIPLGLKLKSLYPILGIFLGTFVLVSMISEFYRPLRRSSNPLRSFLRNRRRYGGYIVHIGVAIMFVGLVSSPLKIERTARDIKPGDSFRLGEYTFKFEGISLNRGRNFEMVSGRLRVMREGKTVGRLSPANAFYPRTGEITAEVDIRSGFLSDIYAILLDASEDKASFRVYITPLVSWIWMGCWVMLAGSLFALLQGRLL
ncbi:heme lyase CcmF/NrfE family subunit [Candidatus Poribacteria bacterium]|nr:heme lyase CcmF/NrfE family subunit [Candidatus Poribacteria bacterium]